MDGLINYLPSWLKKRYNKINPILSVKVVIMTITSVEKVRIKTFRVFIDNILLLSNEDYIKITCMRKPK